MPFYLVAEVDSYDDKRVVRMIIEDAITHRSHQFLETELPDALYQTAGWPYTFYGMLVDKVRKGRDYRTKSESETNGRDGRETG